MRDLGLWVVLLSLLLTSCANNNSIYKGTSVESEKSYKTIQRPNNSNVQKFKRVALVIGNNDYEEAPLNNAVNDARAMRAFLKSKKFEVLYAENATEKVMRNKVDDFLDSLDEESVGFVYYSGHGIQEYSNKEKRITNYLIPIDNSKFKRKTDLDYSSISLNYLLDVLSAKENGLNIVMVDACRSPFKSFSKSINNGLAPSNAKGVYIAYATADGEKALDDGLFRRSFIKYANQPLKLIEIFERVKVDVYNQSKQFPFISNGKRGVFYFTKPQKNKVLLYQDNQDSKELEICKYLTNESLNVNRMIYMKTLEACKKVDSIIGKGYEAKALYKLNDISKSRGKFKNIIVDLEKKCRDNNIDACNLMRFYSYNISKNYSNALKFSEKSCNLNSAEGCLTLANSYWYGEYVSKNMSKAIEYLDKSCTLKNTNACAGLAYAYQSGQGVEKNHNKAIEIYKKNCNDGSLNSCKNLGKIYLKGQGISINYSKAKELFQKSCDLGLSRGCHYLGDMYRKGQGVSIDYYKVSDLYQKSCNLGDSNSCNELAFIYMNGKGISKDETKAVKLLQQACNIGNLENSCNNLAVMYKDGRGVTKDRVKAKEIFKKSCSLGSEPACWFLKEMN